MENGFSKLNPNYIPLEIRTEENRMKRCEICQWISFPPGGGGGVLNWCLFLSSPVHSGPFAWSRRLSFKDFSDRSLPSRDRDRRFKSSHPEHLTVINSKTYSGQSRPYSVGSHIGTLSTVRHERWQVFVRELGIVPFSLERMVI